MATFFVLGFFFFLLREFLLPVWKEAREGGGKERREGGHPVCVLRLREDGKHS